MRINKEITNNFSFLSMLSWGTNVALSSIAKYYSVNIFIIIINLQLVLSDQVFHYILGHQVDPNYKWNVLRQNYCCSLFSQSFQVYQDGQGNPIGM